jgi:hypothetical protein
MDLAKAFGQLFFSDEDLFIVSEGFLLFAKIQFS